MENENKKSPFRVVLDFFAMLTGITTESTLARADRGPVSRRGLFLFRKPERDPEKEEPPKSTPNP